jgi:ubiquinone/menaquinone biosynthesis C-methylase UbiE
VRNDGPMEDTLLDRMRQDWNKRACENACHYVQTGQEQWEDRDFFRSGEINIANEVMPDMVRICGGSRSPLDLKVLEIGCGVGRMTRMLARILGHVTALDISEEMLRQARNNLKDLDNVTLVLGDGCSLSGQEPEEFDFSFSFIVFQHVPNTRLFGLIAGKYFAFSSRMPFSSSRFKGARTCPGTKLTRGLECRFPNLRPNP